MVLTSITSSICSAFFRLLTRMRLRTCSCTKAVLNQNLAVAFRRLPKLRVKKATRKSGMQALMPVFWQRMRSSKYRLATSLRLFFQRGGLFKRHFTRRCLKNSAVQQRHRAKQQTVVEADSVAINRTRQLLRPGGACGAPPRRAITVRRVALPPRRAPGIRRGRRTSTGQRVLREVVRHHRHALRAQPV